MSYAVNGGQGECGVLGLVPVKLEQWNHWLGLNTEDTVQNEK